MEAAEEKDDVQTGSGTTRKMYNTDFNEIPTMVGIKEFDAAGLHASISAQVHATSRPRRGPVANNDPDMYTLRRSTPHHSTLQHTAP